MSEECHSNLEEMITNEVPFNMGHGWKMIHLASLLYITKNRKSGKDASHVRQNSFNFYYFNNMILHKMEYSLLSYQIFDPGRSHSY